MSIGANRWGDGPRGLFCPHCGTQLDNRLIAQTYSTPSGVFRRRVCSGCHRDIETLETVIGQEGAFVDVKDLSKGDRMMLTRLLRRLRGGAG